MFVWTSSGKVTCHDCLQEIIRKKTLSNLPPKSFGIDSNFKGAVSYRL